MDVVKKDRSICHRGEEKEIHRKGFLRSGRGLMKKVRRERKWKKPCQKNHSKEESGRPDSEGPAQGGRK